MPEQEAKNAPPAVVSGLRGAQNGSFTRLQTANVLLMMIFMGAQLSLPFTLSVYMVRDFFAAQGKSEQVIAQLTGVLAATQSLGRAIASYPWGMVSDIIGRKICILIGLVAGMVSLLGYGYSTSYLGAILGRFMPSLFVGSPVALKAAMGDVCDQEGQAKVMAMFILGHGIGSVMGCSAGPALGGTLAYPCKKFDNFPACSEGALFQRRPYLLPCLAVSALGVLATLSMALLFKETHPQIAEAPGGWIGNLGRMLTCRSRRLEKEHTAVSSDKQDSRGKNREDADKEMGSSTLEKPDTDIEMGLLDSKKGASSATEGSPQCSASDSSSRANSTLDEKAFQPDLHSNGSQAEEKGKLQANKDHQDFREGDNEEERESQGLLRNRESGLSAADSNQHRWWKDGNVNLTLIGAGLMALIFNFLNELTPIFVSAPYKNGGLAMSLEAFTWPISCAGIIIIIYSLTFYPRLIKYFGAVSLARIGMLLGLPGVLLMPLSTLFPPYILQQVCLYLAVMIINVSKITGLNSSNIAVNLVADKRSMGRINGAAMSLQSGGRALGPILSGSLWAGSVSLDIPGQQFLGFAVIALALIATQFLYLCVRIPKRA